MSPVIAAHVIVRYGNGAIALTGWGFFLVGMIAATVGIFGRKP